MKILFTDLDLTLLSKGRPDYDDSLPFLLEKIKKNDIALAYSSGRSLKSILESITKNKLPYANYICAQVGTCLYKFHGGSYIEDSSWQNMLTNKTTNWNLQIFKDSLKSIPKLTLQSDEDQNAFKLSYYLKVDDHYSDNLEQIQKTITKLCPGAEVLSTHLPDTDFSYIDILPRYAKKLNAAKNIIQTLNLPKEDIIFAGDSANDADFLISEYQAILVNNASPEFKKFITKERQKIGSGDFLYIAHGENGLNGNYSSGILEGLQHFNWI